MSVTVLFLQTSGIKEFTSFNLIFNTLLSKDLICSEMSCFKELYFLTTNAFKFSVLDTLLIYSFKTDFCSILKESYLELNFSSNIL